ncbi:MAG TPA: hypothetical protein VJB66_03415 [Candidatus Nanoarchaeia archaeon]|nr:hypothetical protein [Candidatus Nanoarchaeia archaeon]
MAKILWLFRWLAISALITSGVIVATNNPVRDKLFTTLNYYAVSTDGEVPAAVLCNVQLAGLAPSTVNIIQNNPRGVCLGGLSLANGAPVLGDVNRQAVLNTNTKFGADIVGTVANGVLICQVPCSNGFASEIKTCNDFSGRPAQQSYSIQALNNC